MFFYFLVEDLSGAALIETLMRKITASYADVYYECKSFAGIGHLPKVVTAKEAKNAPSVKLLNSLPRYLKGLDKSLQNIPAAIVVVLDNDQRVTETFYAELQNVALKCDMTVDHVFCVAVEEMEAWLLGDEPALVAAYPNARLKPLHDYTQDSICGTWEVLADVVYPGGLGRFKKDCPTYIEKGKYKSEWAKKIGEHMDLQSNKSPSFQRFLLEITQRLPSAS